MAFNLIDDAGIFEDEAPGKSPSPMDLVDDAGIFDEELTGDEEFEPENRLNLVDDAGILDKPKLSLGRIKCRKRPPDRISQEQSLRWQKKYFVDSPEGFWMSGYI